MKGFTKGKGEGKKFIPTEHKPKGVSKEKIATSGKSSKLDNSKLLAKKTNNLITKEKAQSLSDGDLKRSIDFVNRIFSNQTQHLESNGGKFDSDVSEKQHEKTLDTLNMLIELRQQRKDGGRNMTHLENFDDDEDEPEKIEPNPDYKVGDRVRVSSENDNENYDDFKDKILIVTDVTTIDDDHPAFDETMGSEGLYSFKTEDGKEVHSSLYDYELQSA